MAARSIVTRTWILRTVNGNPLPFGAESYQLLKDTLVLQPDGTGQMTVVLGMYGLPLPTLVYPGHWTLTDTNFVFSDIGGHVFVGTATATRIAVVDTMPPPGITAHGAQLEFTR